MKRALGIMVLVVALATAAAYAGPTISLAGVWFEGGTVIAPGMGYQPNKVGSPSVTQLAACTSQRSTSRPAEPSE